MLDSFSKKESDGVLTKAEADDGQSNIAAVVFNVSKVTIARNHNTCVRSATRRQAVRVVAAFSSHSHQLGRTKPPTKKPPWTKIHGGR
jgi:hypothetical protein